MSCRFLRLSSSVIWLEKRKMKMSETSKVDALARLSFFVLAGTIIGTVLAAQIEGCNHLKLQKSQHQSDLILKGLGANDRNEIARYFMLLVELDLIEDDDLKEKIRRLSEEPDRLPLILLNDPGNIPPNDPANHPPNESSE